jgi:hypothetical protein
MGPLPLVGGPGHGAGWSRCEWQRAPVRHSSRPALDQPGRGPGATGLNESGGAKLPMEARVMAQNDSMFHRTSRRVICGAHHPDGLVSVLFATLAELVPVRSTHEG